MRAVSGSRKGAWIYRRAAARSGKIMAERHSPVGTSAMETVIRHLRRAAVVRYSEYLSDAQLLDRFLNGGDEAAFEALVRRLGPMVLGVCRRLLRNEADVEDAFQATFVVLARKAATVKPRDAVARWLYGVAR